MKGEISQFMSCTWMHHDGPCASLTKQCRLQSLQCAPDCSMMSHPFQCVTATPTAEDRSTFITIERSSSSGVDIKSWQRLAQGLTRFTWKTCQHLVQNDTYYPSPRRMLMHEPSSNNTQDSTPSQLKLAQCQQQENKTHSLLDRFAVNYLQLYCVHNITNNSLINEKVLFILYCSLQNWTSGLGPYSLAVLSRRSEAWLNLSKLTMI